MTESPRREEVPVVRGRRLDESMTLLREVMERPLDPGYAAAAARRQDGGPEPRRHAAWLLVVAAVLGFATATAVVTLKGRTPSVEQAQMTLIEQVRQRSEDNDVLEASLVELQGEIQDLQERALGSNSGLLSDITVLGIDSGATPVTGQGMSIVLTDPVADAGSELPDDERVLDIDLQMVANSLWASGAEAIAINGHRLTSMSAIRSAGRAILVDLQPLVPPYTIEAIGSTSELQANFARTSGGRQLQTLKENTDIGVTITGASELHIAGSDTVTLRFAAPLAAEVAPTQHSTASAEATP